MKVFYNCLRKELSQKKRRNHHRLARSASQLNVKSRMVDSILFEKESNLYNFWVGQLTLRQLAYFA